MAKSYKMCQLVSKLTHAFVHHQGAFLLGNFLAPKVDTHLIRVMVGLLHVLPTGKNYFSFVAHLEDDTLQSPKVTLGMMDEVFLTQV